MSMGYLIYEVSSPDGLPRIFNIPTIMNSLGYLNCDPATRISSYVAFLGYQGIFLKS